MQIGWEQLTSTAGVGHNAIELVVGNPFTVTGLGPSVGASCKGNSRENGSELHLES